jgi:hypothetical protein
MTSALKLQLVSLTLIAISLQVRSEAQDLGGPCIPASERAGRTFGCFIVASLPVGQLKRAVFWHVETFARRAAAEKAKGARGVVVEAFDKVWLLTIADAGWRSQGGTHVANIGPVPALVLILHDSMQRAAIPASDWMPKGLCKG